MTMMLEMPETDAAQAAADAPETIVSQTGLPLDVESRFWIAKIICAQQITEREAAEVQKNGLTEDAVSGQAARGHCTAGNILSLVLQAERAADLFGGEAADYLNPEFVSQRLAHAVARARSTFRRYDNRTDAVRQPTPADTLRIA